MEVVAPILKYYTKVVEGGRIVIPKSTRKIFRIHKGDYVKFKVAKVLTVQQKVPVLGPQAIVSERLENRGMVHIPKDIREKLGLSPGDIVQIELLDYHSS